MEELMSPMIMLLAAAAAAGGGGAIAAAAVSALCGGERLGLAVLVVSGWAQDWHCCTYSSVRWYASPLISTPLLSAAAEPAAAAGTEPRLAASLPAGWAGCWGGDMLLAQLLGCGC